MALLKERLNLESKETPVNRDLEENPVSEKDENEDRVEKMRQDLLTRLNPNLSENQTPTPQPSNPILEDIDPIGNPANPNSGYQSKYKLHQLSPASVQPTESLLNRVQLNNQADHKLHMTNPTLEMLTGLNPISQQGSLLELLKQNPALLKTEDEAMNQQYKPLFQANSQPSDEMNQPTLTEEIKQKLQLGLGVNQQPGIAVGQQLGHAADSKLELSTSQRLGLGAGQQLEPGAKPDLAAGQKVGQFELEKIQQLELGTSQKQPQLGEGQQLGLGANNQQLSESIRVGLGLEPQELKIQRLKQMLGNKGAQTTDNTISGVSSQDILTKLLLSQSVNGQTLQKPNPLSGLAQSGNLPHDSETNPLRPQEQGVQDILSKLGIQRPDLKKPCNNNPDDAHSTGALCTHNTAQNIETKLEELLKEKDSQASILPTTQEPYPEAALPTLSTVIDKCRQQQFGEISLDGRPNPVHPVSPLLDPDNPCRLAERPPGTGLDLMQVMELKARAAESGEGMYHYMDRKHVFVKKRNKTLF